MKKEVLILYTMLSQEDRDKVDAQIRALFAKKTNSPRTGDEPEVLEQEGRH